MKYSATGHGMPVFAGASYQRGYGLGRVMKNMVRMATPILKKAGSKALKSGLSIIAESVIPSKRNIKRKMKINRRPSIRGTLKKRGVVRVSPLNQKGSGSVLKRKTKKAPKRKTKKAPKRKSKKDIFSYK